MGDQARVNLFGYSPTVLGSYVKVNDTWLEVVGVLAPQMADNKAFPVRSRMIEII